MPQFTSFFQKGERHFHMDLPKGKGGGSSFLKRANTSYFYPRIALASLILIRNMVGVAGDGQD